MYYLIGMDEVNVNSLAHVLKDLGYKVSGSYPYDDTNINGLEIKKYNENNINKGLIVIKGDNITEENIELQKAYELNLKIYTINEMINKFSRLFTTIAVTGSYDNTMICYLLTHILDSIKGCNYMITEGSAKKENKYFVYNTKPNYEFNGAYSLITGIDSNDDINSYLHFSSGEINMIIACGDYITDQFDTNNSIFFYGLNNYNDIKANNIKYTTRGISFDVLIEDNYYGHFDIPLYGKNSLINALGVIGICYYERLSARDVSKAIKSFKGIKNYFDVRYSYRNIVISDKAKYPIELRNTIKAARQKYPNRDVILIGKFDVEINEQLLNVLKLAQKIYVLGDNVNKIPKAIEFKDTKELKKYKKSVFIFLGDEFEDIITKFINQLSSK